MKYSYLKKTSILLLLIILTFSFFSCKEKEASEEEKAVAASLNDFMYEYTYNALDPYSYRTTYLPKNLKNLLTTTIIKNGVVCYVYEELFNNSSRYFFIDSDYENLYDCHSDDASWVDPLITSMEEERLGKQIEEMENILSSEEIYVDEQEESKETEELIEEIESKHLLDNNRNLASAEYEKEIFIPKKNGENWILIHAFENDVKRFFYDKLFRCYKEEDWEIKQGQSEKVLKTIETSFTENTYSPVKRTTATETSYKVQNYNINGYLSEEENFSIYEEKKYITNSLSLKYDKENNVIESTVVEYKYTDDKYTKLDYSFEKKYLYKYNKDDISPNFDYYENDILKMSNEYSSKGNYTSQIFFEDGFSVLSKYEDNKLKQEVFTINGKEERIKNYE